MGIFNDISITKMHLAEHVTQIRGTTAHNEEGRALISQHIAALEDQLRRLRNQLEFAANVQALPKEPFI